MRKRFRVNLLWIGLSLVPIFWLLDVVVDGAFFSPEAAMEELFHPEPVEVWMRSIVSAVVVVFAFCAQRINERLDSARLAAEKLLVERERGQRERDEQQRHFRLVLESTSDGILAVDATGKCLFMNAAAAELLERKADEVVGTCIHDLVHRRFDVASHTPESCPLLQLIRAGAPLRRENEVFFRASGSTLRTETSLAPIIDNDALNGSVVTFIDLSARKALERQLDDARRIGSLGRLAASVAHEFNNVLMGIQPFAEILLRSETNPGRQASTQQILQSIKRGKRITEEILRFARPAEVETKPIQAQQWLGGLAREIAPLIGDRTLLVQTPEEPLHLSGDRLQLSQVMINLVRNACDAMPDGGTLTLTAVPVYSYQKFSFAAFTTPDRFVHLTVQDTGVGIPTDVLPHIFEPLFTTKKSNGTGLGLAIAHQIVGRHAGHIFVESTAGRGTTFHILIPATAHDEISDTQPTASRDTDILGTRVLLVEDDEGVGAGIAALLEDAGMKVTLVTTGGGALRALDREQPDAVVLDIGLPDMDGTDVYREISARYPGLPVIFSTGHADEARLSAWVESANVRFLRKPYDAEALLQFLAQLIAGDRLRALAC